MADLKMKGYNYVYELINDYSSAVPTTVVLVAGGMTFGVKGMFCGIGVSLVDYWFSNNSSYEDKLFTHGFVGFSLGYNIYPTWQSGVVMSGAVLLSKLENIEEYYYLLGNVMLTGALGVKFGGAVGGVLGVALSVFDYILVKKYEVGSNYCMFCLIGVSSCSSVFGQNKISYVSGAAAGGILGFYLQNSTNPLNPSIALVQELYEIYIKIIPKKELESFLEDYTLTLFSSQIIINQLRVIFLKHQQTMMYCFEHICDREGNAIIKLTEEIYKFTFFIAPYVATHLVTDMLNHFYSTNLYIKIDDRLREILYSDETALRLSFDTKNSVLIDNLHKDSRVVTKDGAILISDLIAKHIEGLYGMSVLISNSPELFLYSMLYNKLMESVSNYLAYRINQIDIIIKEKDSVISSLYKHDINNIKIITETKATIYSFEHIQHEYYQLRTIEIEKEQIIFLLNYWKMFKSITNFALTYYFVGYKLGKGEVDFNDRIKVHYSCIQVSNFLFWGGEKSSDIKNVYQSAERIDLYLKKTIFCDNKKYMKTEGVFANNADNIIRNANCEEGLILSDISLVIGNKILIQIKELEFKLNTRYAIEGKSGSGKSSLMTKIMGIKDNQVGGEGVICSPSNFNVTLVSQQVYFPLNKTFEEIVFYPKNVNMTKHNKLEIWLTKLGLNKFNLNQVENWYAVLSGGEKQKIKVLSAIVNEVDVLILDEIFNGLDKNSIYVIQEIILLELADKLIISIDHKAKENNELGFYQEFIDFNEFVAEDREEIKFQLTMECEVIPSSYESIFYDNQVCLN